MNPLMSYLKFLPIAAQRQTTMTDPLAAYIQDHLAGARFAVTLLQDLSKQNFDSDVAHFAIDLRSQVEADRQVLEEFSTQLGSATHSWKEVAAWVAQKVSQLKLNLNTALGIFEAIEFLALGVQGKLALWRALDAARDADSRVGGLDLSTLSARAQSQYQELESLRLKLVPRAIQSPKA